MGPSSEEKLFQRGTVLLRQGRMAEAGAVFKQLVVQGSTDPLHLSYHGLLLTMARRKCGQGVDYCQKAIALRGNDPQLYLNLVRVHELLGERDKAVKVLRTAIRKIPKNKRLFKEIQRLSPRRQPPLSFLRRDQFLNKHLAKLIDRYSKGTGSRRRKVHQPRHA